MTLEIPKPSPLLEELVASAIKHFNSNTSVKPGEAYVDYHAARDAIEDVVGRGVTPEKLATQIIQETSLTPLDVTSLSDSLGGAESWDDFFCQVAEEILVAELERRHPELRETVDQRMDAAEAGS